MAYQRPFLVSMKKVDPQQPWGFRTFGGKEYGQPHVVEKVLEDSNAERCGLREGDEIIQIGRINVQDMTFGQVQEILARCGNKIEMFIIREDLLSPRKGKEPPYVKAVVHNPYNSPLNLYSTENIAETLAKQTEVLTEGHIIEEREEEEEGPENLSFKQKSAVFQLLEEQAKQESTNQYPSKGSSTRKAAPPPPPPPKPRPPAPQTYQNKENYYPSDSSTIVAQPPAFRSAYSSPPNDYYSQSNSVEFRKEEQKTVNYQQQQSQQTVRHIATNNIDNYDHYNSTGYRTVQKVEPPPPPKRDFEIHSSKKFDSNMTTAYKQQPQYHSQQYQEQESSYPRQMQWQQQQEAQQRQQQEAQQRHQQRVQQQHEKIQQSQYNIHQHVSTAPSQQKVESIFDAAPQPVGEPMTYKAPPPQRCKVNWPPATPQGQQNGRWSTPSPTPQSPSRIVESVWPPKQPTVKELPRSGFNPAVLREQGTGRKCVWPPPKPDDEFRSGRTTPQSPVSGRRIIFNPSPSPPLTRRSPFGSVSPVFRRKDISWPPPAPTPGKTETYHQKPSPVLARKARFDEYVHQNTSNTVPTAYRPPPGTQHVQYC